LGLRGGDSIPLLVLAVPFEGGCESGVCEPVQQANPVIELRIAVPEGPPNVRPVMQPNRRQSASVDVKKFKGHITSTHAQTIGHLGHGEGMSEALQIARPVQFQGGRATHRRVTVYAVVENSYPSSRSNLPIERSGVFSHRPNRIRHLVAPQPATSGARRGGGLISA
jgi:hypothetical protein